MGRIRLGVFGKSIVTYSLLYPTANVIQQKFSGTKELDWKESARYCVFGTSVVGPMVYGWQKILNRVFPQIAAPYIALKVFLDQVVYGPIAISLFYAGLSAMEFKSISQIKEEVKEKFPKTYMTGLLYWSTVQTINFRYLPFEYRTIFVSVMSFFWTIGLSYVKSTPI